MVQLSTNYASIMYADGTTPYNSARFYRERNNDDADAQFNREIYASSNLRPKVYLYSQVWLTVAGWTDTNPLNLWVCVKGGMTALSDGHPAAYSCGRIIVNAVAYQGRDPFAFAKVRLETGTVRGGDSGGPIFRASTGVAHGTLTCVDGAEGEVTFTDFCYNKMHRVLNELGASLATG